jgi:hypothetical protein
LLVDADRRRDDGGGQTTEDPDEAVSGRTRASVEERVKLALEGHPTAYRIARRLRAGLRRV